jgi:hypothetical protein
MKELISFFLVNGCRVGLVFSIFAVTSSQLCGQVKVNGGFLSDSVKIGEETAFYLSAHYPQEATVLFPDTLHSYTPFEFQRKEYFPTQTTKGISFDSTVYYLTTFEIDPLLGLDLPVYVVNEQDCTEYRSNVDSIKLIQLVAAVPDSIPIERLPLKMNVAYHPVDYDINYFVVSIVSGVVLVLVVVIWIVFGKRIARHFRARRLRKLHRTFAERYDTLAREALAGYSPVKTESVVSLWKKYLESLESRPYTKLTSRETVRLLNDQNIGKDLFLIDRAIYGNESHVAEPLQRLRSFADARFKLKLQEVMHGE